jgi:ankyrin repeat protein
MHRFHVRRDSNGHTPLHKAAQVGSCRMIEALLSMGAVVDPNEIPSLGAATPLVLAVRADHLDCVDSLADSGADVNIASTLDGTTPLMLAAAAGSAHMVKYLLSRGADTGMRDASGFNASQHAAVNGFKHILAIASMPPPSAPIAEEVVAYQELMKQQYDVLMGPKAEKKPKKSKK